MIQAIRLAELNYKNDKRSSRTFSWLLIACLTSVFLLLIFAKGFITLENNYKTEDVSLREIRMWEEDPNGGDIVFDDNKNKIIAGFTGVEHVSQYFNVELQDSYHVVMDDVTLGCLSYIRGINRHFSFAPQSLIQKKAEQPIVAGRNVSETNNREVLIDENICYLLKYETPEQAIGKKIEIVLQDKVISDVEIVGVYSAKYSDYEMTLSELDEMSRQSELESLHSNPFYFSDGLLQEIVESDLVISWDYEDLIVLSENTDWVKRICDLGQSVCGYSSFSRIEAIETKVEEVRAISVFVIMIIIIALLIAIIIVLNALSIKIIHQRKLTEMLMRIGFQRKDIIGAYVMQNMVVAFRAGITAGLVAFLLGIGIDRFLQNIYYEISSKQRFVFVMDVPTTLEIIVGICMIIGFVSWLEAMLQVTRKEVLWGLKHE